MIKSIYPIWIFFLRSICWCMPLPVFSQTTAELFTKRKEQENQTLFYQDVFKNPSLMADFRKHSVSELQWQYSNKHNEVYRIQTPEGERLWSIDANAFLPIEKQQFVWGKASYHHLLQKNVRWNESLDYQVLYPYFTADSVGGNLQQENYAFTGGYAKNASRWKAGITLDYQAKLASRNKDPRPKNISSDLHLNIGGCLKNIFGVNIGSHIGFQKYTQANDLKFFDVLGTPPVYHLNAMGYYNHLLKGSKLRSFYEGYGYSAGTVLTDITQSNLLTLNFNQLQLEKIILESNGTQAMQLLNTSLHLHFTKILKHNHFLYGLKISYLSDHKKGIEPILSGRVENNSLTEIAKNLNYNQANNIYQLSGLFYLEGNKQFSFIPFINLQTLREKYSFIKSFQHIDYLNIGSNIHYMTPLGRKNIGAVGIFAHHRHHLHSNALLRNDHDISLSQMMHTNFQVLATNMTKYGINLRLDTHLHPKWNIFWRIGSEVSVINKKSNTFYTLATGIIF